MKIQKNDIVSIDYTLKNSKGNIIDTSTGKDPLIYLHGQHHLIPALENELNDKIVGDTLEVTIPAKDGYGIRDEKFIQHVPISQFENQEDIKIGVEFQTETPDHQTMVFRVIDVNDKTVTLDGNHPLADVDLYFNVKVLNIRKATEEELAHGHPHKKKCCKEKTEEEKEASNHHCECKH